MRPGTLTGPSPDGPVPFQPAAIRPGARRHPFRMFTCALRQVLHASAMS